MRYKRFFVEDDPNHHLFKEFEAFTTRKDIRIHDMQIAGAGDLHTISIVVFYDILEGK